MKEALKKFLDRRDLFKVAGKAATGVGIASFFATSEDVEAAMQNVNKNSKPTELKITDMRVAVVTKAPMTCPIIRIDTNQGIYGLGEVRDGADQRLCSHLEEPDTRRESLQCRESFPQDQTIWRPFPSGGRSLCSGNGALGSGG